MLVDTSRADANAAPVRARRAARWAVTGIVLLAAALRLVPTLFFPSFNYPDEIFQATEQAHRLVYGTGLVPWEFQLGIRSWILPGLLAVLMEAARLLGEGPDYYLPVITGVFALLAAAPAICAFSWCERRFGLVGGVIGGTVVATAPDVVYFAGRTLSEVVAAHVLIVAAYMLEREDLAARRLFVGGVLLGLGFVLRPQLAPALLVVALWPRGSAYRARLPAIIAGGLALLASAALLDEVTLGAPLASIWRYALYNLVYGVSESYGVEPWWYYGGTELAAWGLAVAPLLLLVWIGASEMPMLLAAALAYIAVHSGLAHKEYRFIYPAILLMTVLAAIGLAALHRSLSIGLSGKSWRSAPIWCAALVLAAWGLLSLDVWMEAPFASLRERGHQSLLAASFAAHQESVCGIGLYRSRGDAWIIYGGYTYLHQDVPIYWAKDAEELERSSSAFNLLISADLPAGALGFDEERCFGKVCVWRRAAGCEPAPMSPLPMAQRLSDLAIKR